MYSYTITRATNQQSHTSATT